MFSRTSTILYATTQNLGMNLVQLNNKKANLFSDQSSSSRIDKQRYDAINNVKKSYPQGYYHKNTTEKNSVTDALARVRGGGATVPKKVTGKYELS
uniref:Uncharacterized protein n=1 Tax=viral metagenome TaxID=1070528 RepID=A0A6C0DPZ3_9ZZZZ